MILADSRSAVGSETNCFYTSFLWLPSQKGGVLVCLHWQNQTSSGLSNCTFMLLKGIPSICLWALSQKGSFSVRPQLHQEYTFPGSTKTPAGSHWATLGSPLAGISSILII
jgi:hypothetical protein